MENLKAIIITVLSFIAADFIYAYTIFLCQEINHAVRKTIREIKSLWRVV